MLPHDRMAGEQGPPPDEDFSFPRIYVVAGRTVQLEIGPVEGKGLASETIDADHRALVTLRLKRQQSVKSMAHVAAGYASYLWLQYLGERAIWRKSAQIQVGPEMFKLRITGRAALTGGVDIAVSQSTKELRILRNDDPVFVAHCALAIVEHAWRKWQLKLSKAAMLMALPVTAEALPASDCAAFEAGFRAAVKKIEAEGR